tara:strand:- start:16828 stop:17214 length:387 start_codon:yes stop_codon:yes gene_type:complete
MTTLEIWLIIILLVSTVANIFMFLFARDQSQRISYFSQNITDLIEILSDYNKHLKKIYSLEMFYGDETLSHLLEHTRALSTILDTDYSDITYITEPLEIIAHEEEEIEEEQEEIEKDVLYAGSRRRNS